MTISFAGRLTLDHMATHVPHVFSVPEGVGTLGISFSHDPHHPGPEAGDIPHQLSISVYGPNGARGTRHNNADQSPLISTHYASPGYVSGPIEPGEWTVEIDVHRVLPPGNVSYRLEIDLQAEETEAPEHAPPVPLAGSRRRGPGWYRGDLHGHTLHSDAILSVADYLDYAMERSLDFVALTDHNTVSGLAELDSLAGDAITIIKGVELTGFHGHALALGSGDWAEWRIRDGETMRARALDLTASGRLFVIAHPKSEGHPFCTGCRWSHADQFPGSARIVEVWNGPWNDSCPQNEQGIRLFYHWLNEGNRMVATSGTDTHARHGPDARLPANMVFADDNTQPDILAAIRAGRLYVSSGPRLDCVAVTTEGTRVGMGDVVPAGRMNLRCRWTGGDAEQYLSGLTAHLIRRGTRSGTWSCAEHAEVEVTVDAVDSDWFVWELRDEAGGVHALTNPFFIGTKPGIWR